MNADAMAEPASTEPSMNADIGIGRGMMSPMKVLSSCRMNEWSTKLE